jgi:hypothetical protein
MGGLETKIKLRLGAKDLRRKVKGERIETWKLGGWEANIADGS